MNGTGWMGAVLVVAAASAASAIAQDEEAPTEVNGVYADWPYKGKTNYPRNPKLPFRLLTSADGRKVRVAPGYYRRANRCDRRATGSIDVATIDPTAKFWMPLRSGRRFSGSGRGRAEPDNGVTYRFTWRVEGRFVSRDLVRGTVTITAKLSSGGRVYLACKPARTTWSAKPVTGDPMFERF